MFIPPFVKNLKLETTSKNDFKKAVLKGDSV